MEIQKVQQKQQPSSQDQNSRLQQNEIKRIDFKVKQQSEKIGKLQFYKQQENYRILFHFAYIAGFKTSLKGLNLRRTVRDQFEKKAFSKGSFGYCTKILAGQQKLCAKCIQYKIQQLDFILREIAFCKLAGVQGYGPKHYKIDNEYDYILFQDCIVFLMELCQSFKNVVFEKYRKEKENKNLVISQQGKSKIWQDIGSCLLKLHKDKIVHRDIKPPNIVFSEKSQKFLLCDFGLAEALQENINQLSTVYRFKGTVGFTLKQLQQLIPPNPKKIQINLYYNDVYALQKTVNFEYNQKNQGQSPQIYYLSIYNQNQEKEHPEFCQLSKIIENSKSSEKQYANSNYYIKHSIVWSYQMLPKIDEIGSFPITQQEMEYLENFYKTPNQIQEINQKQGNIKQALRNYILLLIKYQKCHKYKQSKQIILKKLHISLKIIMIYNKYFFYDRTSNMNYFKKQCQKLQRTYNYKMAQFFSIIYDYLQLELGVYSQSLMNRIFEFAKEQNNILMLQIILLQFFNKNPMNTQKQIQGIQEIRRLILKILRNKKQTITYQGLQFYCLKPLYLRNLKIDVNVCITIAKKIQVSPDRRLRFQALILELIGYKKIRNNQLSQAQNKYLQSMNILKNSGLDYSILGSYYHTAMALFKSKAGQKQQNITLYDLQEGTKSYEKALLIREKVLGKDNVRYVHCVFLVISSYLSQIYKFPNQSNKMQLLQKIQDRYQQIISINQKIKKQDIKRRFYYQITASFNLYYQNINHAQKIGLVDSRYANLGLATDLYFLKDYDFKQTTILKRVNAIQSAIRKQNNQNKFLKTYSVLARLYLELFIKFHASEQAPIHIYKVGYYLHLLSKYSKKDKQIQITSEYYQKAINRLQSKDNSKEQNVEEIPEKYTLSLIYLMTNDTVNQSIKYKQSSKLESQQCR